MTLEKGLRPTNPIHVHVDDTTPVHLHMKRTKKIKGGVPTSGMATANRRPRSSRRATTAATTARARSCSPRAGPWVPAPGKATRGARVTWQGPTRRLGMESHTSNGLSTDEETEVDGQVDLQMALREIEAKEELLDTSQRTIQRQEASLQDMEQELNDREHENFLLRKSVDITKTEKEFLNREREQLMKKLIEVEMDGQAAQQHVRELRDVIRRLRDDNHLAMSAADALRLNKLKEAFFEKMADFEATNRTLRRLLREHHRTESEAARLGEQREALVRKVTDAEACLERLRRDLMDRDRMVEDLRAQVLAQRDESTALTRLQDALESTRAHLQKQLRSKEADCNRMSVQIRTLEGQLAQNKIEMGRLHELVATAKQRGDSDKDALKKATRRVDELETMVDRVEDKAKLQVESLTARLHEKTAEVTSLKLELERLKSSEEIARSKLSAAEEQATQLRSGLTQYEHLVQELRGQIDHSRREIDHSQVRMEEHQREASRLQRDGEVELEKVKLRLHQRLQELEPLPEMLRTTELRLHEANEKLLQYERRNTENTRLVAELTAKVESRGETVENLEDRIRDGQEESRVLQARLDALDRRVKELEDSNRELTAQVARKEEALHQLTLQLEEKTREGAVLTRQLENTLMDLRQQQENTRDRFASKERTYQTRVVDLESQLSQARAEIARVRREKEENERKFNSRLYDLKDRLEQCHSTNRSMQNYVQFLKNSYANVFGETSSYGASAYKPSIP